VEVAPITFAPLRRADFPSLSRWLSEPLVARWWNHETSAEAIERDFGPSIDGADSAEMFIAANPAGPFGLIQRYAIADYPEYVEELSAVCALPPGALSIDYLIGEPSSRGRGMGAAMIARFVQASWPVSPGASAVVVPVSVGNEASWRALERAGFRRIACGQLEPDNPVDSRDHYVYRIDRPADA
jgi:aminoglycoside 6'-N-acetyltransferase